MTRTTQQFQDDVKSYMESIVDSVDMDNVHAQDKLGKTVALLVLCSSVCAPNNPLLGSLLVQQATELTQSLYLIGYETDTEAILEASKIAVNEDVYRERLHINLDTFKNLVGMSDKEKSAPEVELESLFEASRPYGAVADAPDMKPVKLGGEDNG